MHKKRAFNLRSKRKNYLEIYIKDDGDLILAPLVKNTLSFFKAVSNKRLDSVGIYCG